MDSAVFILLYKTFGGTVVPTAEGLQASAPGLPLHATAGLPLHVKGGLRLHARTGSDLGHAKSPGRPLHARAEGE